MYRDLTQPIEPGMSTFPGDPDVDLFPAATIEADGYGVHELRCGSHTGTHVDAPSHIETDAPDVDDRPIAEYVFEARVVDATPLEPRTPIDGEIVPEDVDADILLVYTGWDDHWKSDRYVDHPYLTAAAAKRLTAADCGVGVDTLNPDPTPTGRRDGEPAGFPVHDALLGAGLPIVENLTGLGSLPDRVTLYAFPLPLSNCDGAPVRAVAEL